MKTFAWLILFGFVSQAALSQYKGSTGRIYDSPDELVQNNKFNIVENIQVKGLSEYMLELFPGQVFSGWYYYWSNGDALNCNLKEYPEVEWLNVTPKKFISTGCSDVIPVRYSIQAPFKEGLYETVLVDSTKNWDSTRVKLKVTNSPGSYARRRIGINKDLISYKTYIRNNPLTWEDNSCITNYYPADSISYKFNFKPDLTWLAVNPSSGKIYRNDRQTLQNTIVKQLHDSTWVILERWYYSFPSFYHYIVKTTEPKEYMLKFNGQNMITTGYYPGSSTKTMMFWVRFDEINNMATGVNDLENHRFYLGIQKDNTLFAGMGNGYTPLTSLNLIPGKWYNMALTTSHDSDSAIVYINATEVSRWIYSFSGESKSGFYIAARNDASGYGNNIKGLIEEVQVWERPLSRNEIIKYMFTPPTGNETGLVIYYPFNEGWGDFTQNAADNYYQGTLFKDPVWIDSIKRPNDPSIIITSVEKNKKDLAKTIFLNCHPNPFSINTEISYYLPQNGKVLLQLFDIRGILIKTMVNAKLPHGLHTYQLTKESLPAGMYFVKLMYNNSYDNIIQSVKILQSDF